MITERNHVCYCKQEEAISFASILVLHSADQMSCQCDGNTAAQFLKRLSFVDKVFKGNENSPSKKWISFK